MEELTPAEVSLCFFQDPEGQAAPFKGQGLKQETWEGGSGWGRHVNPWLIHVNVWQKPLQYCKVKYCKVISLQLIKINEKIKKKKVNKAGDLVWPLTLAMGLRLSVLFCHVLPTSCLSMITALGSLLCGL